MKFASKQVQSGYDKKPFWALQLSEVEEMRRRQAKKQNLTRYFKELGLYLVFVFLLMAVCYGNRNDHRYLMTKSIRDGLPNFGKVSRHYLIMINSLLKFACLIYLMIFCFHGDSKSNIWRKILLCRSLQEMTKAFSALVMDILGRNIPLETAYKRYVSARDPNLGMERNSKR